MANKTVRKVKRAVRKVRKVATKIMAPVTALDAKARAAAAMLTDPCNAALSEACYRGDQGYRNRFVSNSSLGVTAGHTAVAVAFVPGSNTVFWLSNTTSSGLVAWASFGGPGVSFLATVTDVSRSLGACTSATPQAANLSVSGQVYSGVVPFSSLNTGATQSADNLAQLCNRYGKISIDTPMECKFVPGAADEDYTATNGQPTDVSDSNVILMVFIGLPAASGVALRFTNIIEWKPRFNLGVTTQSVLGNPSRNTIEHIKEHLRTTNPNWWSNVGATAWSVVRGYATGGVMGAAGAALRSVKFM